MRAMKDSGIEWIGKIPQDWQIAKVKHVYSFQTGWTPSTSNAAYFDGDLPWANISDIGKTKTIYDTAKHITEEAVANSSMGISPKGSLMYSFKLSVSDVSFCGTDMYTNEAIATFLPSDKYDLRYLYYAAPLFIIKNANENIYGAKLLNQELIRNALILNPPYNEQVSVADYLDAKCAEIDALIAAKEKTNALLKERRQSIIYEAVTKGLNSDAPMKDSGVEWIGEIPESWAVGKLGYFIEVFNGDRSSNYPSGSDIQESGVPFLTSSNLEYDVLDMSSSKYISEEKYESMSGLKMELNDIIYCLRGSVGKCSINKTETCGTVASSLMGIRCKKMEPEFLLFVLKSPVIETQNALFMNGTCAANLSAENVCGYLVPIPAKAEQTAIAEYLQDRCTEMDELISANEATIQKLKEYRQSIIYEAVTGKIEI